jgi:hypothetical protein
VVGVVGTTDTGGRRGPVVVDGATERCGLLQAPTATTITTATVERHADDSRPIRFTQSSRIATDRPPTPHR